MEQIKKYNYNDPLHQKGDPFGATEAKVAHVNAVIDEVNSIDTRVITLENAPAPQTTEYFINGVIISAAGVDPAFYVSIYNHNTPIDNSDYFFQNVFAFQKSATGEYDLFVQGSGNLTANLGNGPETCNITHATISSVVFNFEKQLVIDFGIVGKALTAVSISPAMNTDAIEGFSMVKVVTHALGNPSAGIYVSGRTDIPVTSAGMDAAVFNFQIKFSDFIVVPV